MWRRRSGRNRRQAPKSPGYLCIVEPGVTALRLLVAEADDRQTTVWGWVEGPGVGGAQADVQSLIALCGKSLSQAERMAQDLAEFWFLADQVLVGLPASQLRGRAWPIVRRRARPERPIEEQELATLLGRGLRLAINRLESSESEGSDWLLVDAVVVELTVDDRGVTDPVGFRGREMGATVFAALAPADLVRTWGLVAQELEFSALTLMAGPLALARACPAWQGLLVDVGGATTDLTCCQAGRPVALDSLPVGGDDLTAALRRKWNLAHDRAERLKRAYAGQRLAEEGMAQVLGVMSPVLQTWVEETEAALLRLNQDEPLPQQLYLLGGGGALPEMSAAIQSLAWSKRLRFSRYPQVSRLRPTDVPGVVNRTALGRQPGDITALALAAWAARQNKEPDRPTRILSELCHS